MLLLIAPAYPLYIYNIFYILNLINSPKRYCFGLNISYVYINWLAMLLSRISFGQKDKNNVKLIYL